MQTGFSGEQDHYNFIQRLLKFQSKCLEGLSYLKIERDDGINSEIRAEKLNLEDKTANLTAVLGNAA